ncbi:MAG: hypothetical protein AAF614_16940 [Chloroflexota bacterium]
MKNHLDDRQQRWLLWGVSLLSLLLILLVLTDGLPLLRGPAPDTSEWHWPYDLRPFSRWWFPILAALLLWASSLLFVRAENQGLGGAYGWLTAVFLTTLLLQLALIYADNPNVTAELINRTQSNLASGFFEPAVEIKNLNDTLSNYPSAMLQFSSEHARTHPPGLISANWLTVRFFDNFPQLAATLAPTVWAQRCIDLWLLNRPASVAVALGFWAILPLILAAAAVFPAYWLGKQWAAAGYWSKTAVPLGTLFVATLPSLLLFAPKSVQLYPILTLLFFVALHHGLTRPSRLALFIAGLILSLASFLSLGNAALIIIIVVFGSYLLWKRAYWLLSMSIFGLGAASFWLVYWIGWGVPPWAIAQTGLGQHYDLVTLHRRYDWWLVSNLVDLIMYAGLPTVVGFVAATTNLNRKQPLKWLALGTMALIILLNLSGSARGEVGRIWLFFLPLLALLSAAWWSPKRASWLIGLQLLLVLAIGLTWKPVRAVIVVAERPFQSTTPIETALNTPFQEARTNSSPFTLTGYSLGPDQPQPNETLNLTLHWQANRPAERPYTVFTQLLDPEGKLVAQQDNWPVQGQWPPTCWQANETITDSYTLQLPDTLIDGSYQLITGMYDAQTGNRLSTAEGETAVLLTTINIDQQAP